VVGLEIGRRDRCQAAFASGGWTCARVTLEEAAIEGATHECGVVIEDLVQLSERFCAQAREFSRIESWAGQGIAQK
jgi:hypothetical protein